MSFAGVCLSFVVLNVSFVEYLLLTIYISKTYINFVVL